MSAAASKLQSIAGDMSDTGLNVGVLQQAVTGNEAWKGQGATQWDTVMTSRVADANLSNEVLGKGGTLLSQLASDLEAEQQYYNKVGGEMGDAAGMYNPRFNPAPPDWDEPFISAMNASVTRANNLLKSFGDDCLSLAALADDVTAVTAANRTPAEPDGPGGPGGPGGKGTVLATLAANATAAGDAATGGSGITDNGYEEEVLAELGLSKNTTTVGRDLNTDPAKATAGGQPRGTIPDALAEGPGGYVVEIKGYNAESVSARFQIRLGSLFAQTNNLPYYVIAPKDVKVSSSVIRLTERTGGGVLYRTGPNSYEDPSGNPVQVGPGMKVTGYQARTTGGSGGSSGTTGTSGDPQAPSEPVNPANTTGQAPGSGDTGGDSGDTGGIGGGGDPEDPFIDPLP